ncbi:hypothetical protein PDIP_43220 [Penicillium digitatum Pd1]|uniref:Uncharacterized protein n=1 Tax=Penicillium digitatum (strain Pd1 / CECT 20795) TaxID=1170230 RepID=K9GIP4_PEND1|nr:hypothetical protein PDIP_43220 [Penicillium digitatum Pd1]EKV14563.1 hypothetical protein PDIP_43220 [Penicillium digitatum Pd1]
MIALEDLGNTFCSAPWDPPFAGVVHGVRSLHPRATCRSLPAPSRAPGRIPCVRTGAEEFSGGNWMVSERVHKKLKPWYNRLQA